MLSPFLPLDHVQDARFGEVGENVRVEVARPEVATDPLLVLGRDAQPVIGVALADGGADRPVEPAEQSINFLQADSSSTSTRREWDVHEARHALVCEKGRRFKTVFTRLVDLPWCSWTRKSKRAIPYL